MLAITRPLRRGVVKAAAGGAVSICACSVGVRGAAASSGSGVSTTKSKSPLVEVERNEESRVAILRLNYPEKFNALSVEMGDEFSAAVEELASNPGDIGAVVLTGNGKAFSAGGDFQFLKDRHADTPERNAVIMRRFYKRMLKIRELPLPTIAAINGPAIGAGLAVALACDMRVAYKKATMGITFVGLGLHPGMGSTFFLHTLCGPQVAARVALTGDVFSGTEAKELGLVLDTADTPEETVARAVELASKCANKAPVAVRGAVRSLRMLQDSACGGLERALYREADAQAQTYPTDDLIEGVRALEEKRRPVFKNYKSYIE